MELYRIYLKHMKYLFLTFLIIFTINCRSTNDLFFEAVQSRNYQNVVKYLKKGANVNISDDYGKTALIKAADWSNIAIVKLLINHGADINATDCWNNSALVYASKSCCFRDKLGDTDPLGTIKVLIECGADINLFGKDENGRGSSAFYYAAERLDTSLLSLFLDRGAEINQQNEDGLTPLMHVLRNRKRWSYGAEGFKYLLKHGADVNLKDDYGKTALMHAVERGDDDEYIQLLLDKGSDINSQDNEGKTAIILSLNNTVSNDSCLYRDYQVRCRICENEFIDVAKILLLNNADFYLKDNSGKNLFDYLEYRKLPLVKEYLSKAIK